MRRSAAPLCIEVEARADFAAITTLSDIGFFDW
jgi:hypothetical protein